MSYLPLSTIPSRPSLAAPIDLTADAEPTTYPRRPSTLPLLDPNRTTTPRKTSLDWIKLGGGDKNGWNRRLVSYLCIATFFVLTASLWFGTNDRGLSTWAKTILGKSEMPLLLERVDDPPFPNPRTNPLAPSAELDYDELLTLESLPSSISVSTPSSLVVHCNHTDTSECAKAYRVLFIGPTIQSTFYNDSQAIDERRVEVKFEIRDPGEYQVYLWPESETCNQWQESAGWKGRPLFKLAVAGTPKPLIVTGSHPTDSERACTAQDDLTDGRWISRTHIAPENLEVGAGYSHWVESNLHPTPSEAVSDYSTFGYVWTPYSCKIQHRSFYEWLDEVKPESVMMMGDSIMRDAFCLNWGYEDREVCQYSQFGAYEQSDKLVKHVRSDGNETDLNFHWNPLAESNRLESYLTTLAKPPTHIYFNIALWITRLNGDPGYYVDLLRPFLETLVRLVPHAKIVARTSASAVQAINCFDLWNIRRLTLEPVNLAFLSLLQDEFPTITALDAYPIYNDRPDASEDGRHWERIPGSPWSKPEEGALTWAMTDIVFETWRIQESSSTV